MGTLRRGVSSRKLLAGTAIVLFFAAMAIGAPLLAPPQDDDPYVIPRDGFATMPKPPVPGHPLGTMQNQYDIFYGLVWGTRVAFRVGLTITLGRVLIGVVIGAVAGFYGGWSDAMLMRVTDAFMAFPIVAAVLVMLTISVDYWALRLGEGDRSIVLALTLFGWMQYARLARGNVLVERAQEYVVAAISVGARDRRVIFRHVLPNSTRGLFVLAASDVGMMVVTVAALTFIGLSGEEPTADWGAILKYTRNWIIAAPTHAFEFWYTYAPISLAIILFSIGWSLVGDGLRDVFDPRWRSLRGWS